MKFITEKSKTWIKENARPLEIKRMEYHFENGRVEDVIEALAAYQNSDGGFGKGLETDFWDPNSSAVATHVALDILDSLQMDTVPEIAVKAIDYLNNSWKKEYKCWQPLSDHVDNYPHAPWWSARPLTEWNANPTVILLPLFHKYGGDTDIFNQSLQQALAYLEQQTTVESHILGGYTKLLSYEEILIPNKDTYQNHIIEVVEQVVSKNPAEWDSYCSMALDYVDSENSFLYPALKSLVAENIKYYAVKQNHHDLWEPNWNWGQYPKEFVQANTWRTAVITIERLLIIKAFSQELHKGTVV